MEAKKLINRFLEETVDTPEMRGRIFRQSTRISLCITIADCCCNYQLWERMQNDIKQGRMDDNLDWLYLVLDALDARAKHYDSPYRNQGSFPTEEVCRSLHAINFLQERHPRETVQSIFCNWWVKRFLAEQGLAKFPDSLSKIAHLDVRGTFYYELLHLLRKLNVDWTNTIDTMFITK
jgi:hypothetical protein